MLVAGAKTGLKLTPLTVRFERVATVEITAAGAAACLITVRVYDWEVLPSCAVTVVVIVLLPEASAIGADGAPLVATMPFIVKTAFGSLVAGVIVMADVILLTEVL